MVNETSALDQVFAALGDTTRRNIVTRLMTERSLRVSDLSKPFAMSMAAVSKHISVLERAQLVTRTKKGREVYVQLNPQPLSDLQAWLRLHERYWTAALGELETLIRNDRT